MDYVIDNIMASKMVGYCQYSHKIFAAPILREQADRHFEMMWVLFLTVFGGIRPLRPRRARVITLANNPCI